MPSESSPKRLPRHRLDTGALIHRPSNERLQRMPSASPPSPLSRKPFGAAVKIRAGRRRVAALGAAQPRPCVHRPIPASPAGPTGSTHAVAP